MKIIDVTRKENERLKEEIKRGHYDDTALIESLDYLTEVMDSRDALQALLAALSPTWSEQRPTVKGWYWWRAFSCDEPELIRVFPSTFEPGTLYAGGHRYWETSHSPLAGWTGEFAGPLVLPREATK